MSETKFTKGEWYVNHTGKHLNNPNLENYEICYGVLSECICDTVYEVADAHLIAAAPEMYDAITALLDYGNNTNTNRGQWAVNKAYSALAKARGGQ